MRLDERERPSCVIEKKVRIGPNFASAAKDVVGI